MSKYETGADTKEPAKKKLLYILLAVAIVLLLVMIAFFAIYLQRSSQEQNITAVSSENASTVGEETENAQHRALTYTEVLESFATALLNGDAETINALMIPYAGEINIAMESDDFMVIDNTMDESDGNRLVRDMEEDALAPAVRYEIDDDLSFDTSCKYYNNDRSQTVAGADEELEYLYDYIADIFNMHNRTAPSVSNYIYTEIVYKSANDEDVFACEVNMVETDEGCYILAFEPC